MGTQGSGRKRAPLKDRFSAEDEALSSIAREVSSDATRIPFILSRHQFRVACCFFLFVCLLVFVGVLIEIMCSSGVIEKTVSSSAH